MRGMLDKLERPAQATLVEGHFEPDELLAIVSKIDVVISSRLHLLILASNVKVPFVGISPGSKLDSFLRPYGWVPAGTVLQCDFPGLLEKTRHLLDPSTRVADQMQSVQRDLHLRLDLAKTRLRDELNRTSISS